MAEFDDDHVDEVNAAANDLPRDAPLLAAHERAKAWSAASLAVMLVGFVLHLTVLTGVALLALIIAVARWIRLNQRLAEKSQPPESNIIPFRRPNDPSS